MMSNKLIFSSVIIILCHANLPLSDSKKTPDQGFIIYCPCMGRFGNQAEQLLGTLLFAKSLNRTLVLPPFINYGLDHLPLLTPFESIIQVEPIKVYHDVMLLTDFMRQYAENVWPKGERQFYCYSARDLRNDIRTCDALKGQPFNTFWTNFDISEDKSVFYRPLVTNPYQANDWNHNYPSPSHKVLAFVGAPSPFPTHKESIQIQKYIKISENVEKEALEFKRMKDFLDKPYLSMHIRHGSDWKRACELLVHNEEGLTQLFSSAQCTGYRKEDTPKEEKLQFDTCLPSFETISKKLDDSLHNFKVERNVDIKIIHIATDYDEPSLWEQLRARFPLIDFLMTPRDSDTMHGTMIDIYLMANSDVFIGNCISSFSAFPARIRSEQKNLKNATYYFGQDFTTTIHHHNTNDEL